MTATYYLVLVWRDDKWIIAWGTMDIAQARMDASNRTEHTHIASVTVRLPCGPREERP